MKFSTRTTYGIRAMICLARAGDKKSLSLPNISRDEKISLGYLEKIFAKLKKADLIKAEKGVGGGYKLSRPAEKISVYNIVKTLEGQIASFYCLGENGKIKCKNICGASTVLIKVQEAINKTLKKMKLNDLL